MPDLPKKKVGIVACSGEELPQGTVTRLAALQVLEQLRPGETVTICLPLFLAGGQGDRAFAKFFPTIAIDGCEKRCAARATEMYSNRPAASLVVDEIVVESGLGAVQGRRRLNEAGQQAVELTAQRVAATVDDLLGVRWSRWAGQAVEEGPASSEEPDGEARCSCGQVIPSQKLVVEGRAVRVVGLPVIFEQFKQDGKQADLATAAEILDTVKVYNAVPAEAEVDYLEALYREYAVFCGSGESGG